MLSPEKHRERIPPSPPEGLLLKDVRYRDISFQVDEYATRLLHFRLKRRLIESGIRYKLYSLELEAFQPRK